MIATLSGRVSAVGETYLVVEVGGLGLKVHVPAGLLSRDQLGQTVELHTFLRVRENDLSLYGFGNKDELSFFELLLSVNGVGCKAALSLLSTLSPEALRAAIAQENIDVLMRVPGIGSKTARKISFDLKDKVKAGAEVSAVSALTDSDVEIIEALTALGYSVVEAQAALQSLPLEELSLEEKIRLALSYFA
ncbi:MAG: Holliday junction branch migration protein RuvA [Anaerolineaceae bacterium 4572_32.1]|nr:MAG: Holliday junction branch migration protein RuvA [Anaerolineaceae bacterium 4572_32.1]